MRIAYLDCFAGISGDMLLGALVDAAVPRQVLEDAAAAMHLGVRLEFETVDRSGISATKAHVLEGDPPADAPDAEATHPEHPEAGDVLMLPVATPPGQAQPEPTPGQTAPAGQSAGPEPNPAATARPVAFVSPSGRRQDRPQPFSPFDTQRDEELEPITLQPQTQHMHRLPGDTPHTHHDNDGVPPTEEDAGGHGHPHSHEHGHEHSHEHGHEHSHDPTHRHGRSLTQIRAMISASTLADPVKQLAIRAFELLGAAEARIHNVPVDDIHFHEVGAVDAIVDIVAAAAGLLHLGVEQWFCSPLNVGGGMVQCAHGNFPVPAPATADLLRGVPTYSADVHMELVTPTGAALLRALDPTFARQPAMRVEHIGYGAGTRNPERFPNVLRLQIGQLGVVPDDATAHNQPAQPAAETLPQPVAGLTYETVSVLETALDDLSPQLLAHVAEKALAAGALDVMLTPVIMKKGRPGTLITILAAPAESTRFEQLLLRETSTLGVRLRQERRACLDRLHVPVNTVFGTIRIKIGHLAGEELNATPEFEDCRRAAQEQNVPVKLVQQAAMASYHTHPA